MNFEHFNSLKEIAKHKLIAHLSVVLILLLTVIAINLPIIRQGIPIVGDLKWHLIWLQHFSHQLLDEGIWYPRWLAGTNYGYGSPTFVFYPPLVYYIGSIFKLVGLNTETVVIILWSLVLFGCGLSFYIYGCNRWGILASLTGALCYMTSPYILFNVYQRTALAETWALVWLPLIFWLTDRSIVLPKWRLPLAFSFTVIALTHTPSLLMYTIFWFAYIFIFVHSWSVKSLILTFIYAGLGLGLASLYLVPAIWEQPLVNIANMRNGGGGFQENLLYIMYSKSRPVQMAINGIFTCQSLTIILLVFITLFIYRHKSAQIKETLMWLLFSLFLAFLMSYPSLAIWQHSPTLQMIQFPWRLLGLYSFAGAGLCSFAMTGITKSSWHSRKFILLIIISAIIGSYFHSAYKISRSSISIHNPKNSDPNLELYKTIVTDPYTDKLFDFPNFSPALTNNRISPPTPLVGQSKVSVIKGEAEIKIEQWKSYQRLFKITPKKPSTIRIRTYFYPAWHLFINQKPQPIGIVDDGTIKFNLEPGTYTVELRYQWTRAFTIGVVLSVVSLVMLILFWITPPKFLSSEKKLPSERTEVSF